MDTNKCLFCKNENFSKTLMPPTYFNNKIISYVKCDNCNLIQISPLLTDADYSKLYAVEYHEEFYSKEKDYSKKINVIKEFAKSNKFLDYGCGNGYLAKNMSKNGFEACGVDYDSNLVEQLNNNVTEAHFFIAEEFWKNNNQKFDVIHLGDVLEHITNPIEITLKLKSLLSKNGVMVVEGPLEYNSNIAFYSRQFLNWIKSKVNPTLIADHKPYHVVFSNNKNQLAFFNSLDFEKIHYKIYEKAWPYIGEINKVKSVNNVIQYLIAKISIMISTIISKWGNRFIYIGKNNN